MIHPPIPYPVSRRFIYVIAATLPQHPTGCFSESDPFTTLYSRESPRHTVAFDPMDDCTISWIMAGPGYQQAAFDLVSIVRS
jgi:hypothetical protein